MSLLNLAFTAAINFAAAVKGSREKVSFRGKEIDALVYTDNENFAPSAGGDSDLSTIQISIDPAELDEKVKYLEEITIRGVDQVCLNTTYAEGRVDITCGDVSREQR